MYINEINKSIVEYLGGARAIQEWLIRKEYSITDMCIRHWRYSEHPIPARWHKLLIQCAKEKGLDLDYKHFHEGF